MLFYYHNYALITFFEDMNYFKGNLLFYNYGWYFYLSVKGGFKRERERNKAREITNLNIFFSLSDYRYLCLWKII